MSRISRYNDCKCCGEPMPEERGCVMDAVCGKCKTAGHTYFNCPVCLQTLEEEMRREEPKILLVGVGDGAGLRQAILHLVRNGITHAVASGIEMILDIREPPDAIPLQLSKLLGYQPPQSDISGEQILEISKKLRAEIEKLQPEKLKTAEKPSAYPKSKLIKDGRYKWKQSRRKKR